MADRTVSVKLTADVAAYRQSMQQAAADTDKLGKAVEGAGKKGSSLGDSLKKGLQVAGIAGGAAVVAAGFKAVVSAGLDYDRQLNTIKAVSGATAKQMAAVSDVAKQLGNDITLPGQSASTAAQAMAELAKGGLSVEQAMAAAKGTLQLASAAQIDGGQAATIQANALNTFSLKADQAGHVADLLANAANKSSGEITDFAMALAQGGLVADQAGISIDDTVTALAEFAQAGLKGSDAGTSLKTALLALQTPNKQQTAALSELGVTVYDTQGKFEGLRNLSSQLADAQKSMSQEAFNAATGIAFGSDAVRTASVLAKNGVTGWDEYAAAIGHAGGAQELAAAQAEGLPGKIGNLTNALETAGLTIYQTLEPALGALVDAGSGLIGILTKIPGPVYAAVAAFTAFKLVARSDWLASFKTNLGGFSTAVKQVRIDADESGRYMSKFGATAKVAGEKFGGIAKNLAGGAAFVGVGLAIDALSTAYDNAKPKVTDFSAAVDQNTGALNNNAAAASAAALAQSGAFDVLAKAGVSSNTYTQALLGNADAQKLFNDQLQAAGKAAFKSGDINSVYDFARALGQASEDQKNLTDAQRHGQQVAEAAGEIMTRNSDAAEERSRAAAANVIALKEQADALATAKGAEDRYASSLQSKGVAQAFIDRNVAASKLAAAEGVLEARQIGAASAAEAAVAKSEALRGALDDLSPAAQAAADASNSLSRAVENVNAAMDKDKSKSYEDAMRALHGEISGLSTAFGQGTKDVDGFSNAMVDNKGHIDTSTKSGQDLYDTVGRLADASHTAAQAAFDHAGGLKNSTKATAAAKGASQDAYDAFMATATALGLDSDHAKDVAKQYGLVPTDVSTEVKSNAEAEKAKVDAYNAALAEANGKIVTSTIRTINENIVRNSITNFVFGESATTAAATKASRAQPHAAGGTITGGTPGRDSVHAMLMPGEEVVKTSAANRGNNRSVLKAMNAGLLHFASGGTVPSVGALAGFGSRNLGAREGVAVGALGDLAQYVKDLGANARDASDALRDAMHVLRAAENTRRSEISAVEKSNAEKLHQLAADNAVRLSRAKDAKARARVSEDNARRTEKADKAAAAALDKVTKAQNAKVAATQREALAASRAAKAANTKADGEAVAYRATEKARAVQRGLTQEYDRATDRLAADTDKLNSINQDKAQLAGSVASGIKGIGGGVAGFQDQRTTVASILNGAAYNARNAGSFKNDIARLNKLGLNAQTLQELSDPNNARTAHTLAGGSAADIKKLNALVGQTNAYANQAGAVVAGATYNRSLTAAQNQVNADQRLVRTLNTTTLNLARGIAREFSDALDGHIAKVTTQGLAVLVRKGESELKRRGA